MKISGIGPENMQHLRPVVAKYAKSIFRPFIYSCLGLADTFGLMVKNVQPASTHGSYLLMKPEIGVGLN